MRKSPGLGTHSSFLSAHSSPGGRPIHVLYTATRYWPVIGGAETYLRERARHLAQAGHRVGVAAIWDRNRTDWLLGTTLRAPTRPRRYRDGPVAVTLLSPSRFDRAVTAPALLGYYPAQRLAVHALARTFVPGLERVAKEIEPDVVHSSRIGREPLTAASLALARRREVPFVLTPHHHPRWTGPLFREWTRLYRAADAILAQTEDERRTLLRLGVAESRIYRTGMGPVLAAQADGAAYRQRHGVDGPLVLFLGQKYPYKGVTLLLAAAPLVWRHCPEARFHFLGPRTAQSSAWFRAVDDPRIVERGAVSLQEKTDALAACDLLCVPSSQESFGGVYLEAWSLGKPVIARAIPAVREVVADGEDGLLLPPGEGPAALAERVLTLLRDPALAQRLGAAGQAKVAARYTWERLAAETLAIYRAVGARG